MHGVCILCTGCWYTLTKYAYLTSFTIVQVNKHVINLIANILGEDRGKPGVEPSLYHTISFYHFFHASNLTTCLFFLLVWPQPKKLNFYYYFSHLEVIYLYIFNFAKILAWSIQQNVLSLYTFLFIVHLLLLVLMTLSGSSILFVPEKILWGVLQLYFLSGHIL